jgi:hypothetical protein
MSGIIVKEVKFGNNSDTRILLGRELSVEEENMLYVLAKSCKTQLVVICTYFPLKNPSYYEHRMYRELRDGVESRNKHVYINGNAELLPAQHNNGYIMYACVVILFERNGIWYTTRVKVDGGDRLALVSFNFTTSDADQLNEMMSKTVFNETGIYASKDRFREFAYVVHTGGNATLDIAWTMMHNFYCCVLSQGETDAVFAKYDVDDCLTDNLLNHYHSKLQYAGDNMIRDNRIIIIPVAISFSVGIFAKYELHQTTEYIAAEALAYCEYGKVKNPYNHDFRLNRKGAKMMLY